MLPLPTSLVHSVTNVFIRNILKTLQTGNKATKAKAI